MRILETLPIVQGKPNIVFRVATGGNKHGDFLIPTIDYEDPSLRYYSFIRYAVDTSRE